MLAVSAMALMLHDAALLPESMEQHGLVCALENHTSMDAPLGTQAARDSIGADGICGPRVAATVLPPTVVWPPIRRRSELSECQATPGPRLDPHFLESFRPCGTLSSVCTDLPLVEANKDYPGGGVGAVVPGQDYVVQFDIGLHPAVAREVMRNSLKEIDSCLNCPVFEEKCFEAVVTGGDMWGDLSLPNMSSRAYDCMGGCGKGCFRINLGRTRDDIGALDCLKHDVCSAWKSVRMGRAARGFCHDPDCGDEAAMSIFNCWKGWRLFGSMGGNRPGPFAEPAVCVPQDPKIHGCWSHSGWFTNGRCKVFQGWKKGQGIPDPHPLRSPIQRL